MANAHREDLIVGRRFWKMSGSGNDFVVFDSRGLDADPGSWERPEAVQALCARGMGVGADGVVVLAEPRRAGAALAMRYYNSDGSRGAFCGNATLCVTRLAHELGVGAHGQLSLETDSGLVPTRMGASGPEIELPAVSESALDVRGLSLDAGEHRIGFALAGVAHLVVRCDDVERVPVGERGRELRWSDFRPGGANVNFVSSRDGRWSIALALDIHPHETRDLALLSAKGWTLVDPHVRARRRGGNACVRIGGDRLGHPVGALE